MNSDGIPGNSGLDDPCHVRLCYPVERYLLGFAVRNRERLISAMIRTALVEQPQGFECLTGIREDRSLETIGDFVLDFVVIDTFATQGQYTAQEIDDLRQWYGKNAHLQYFARECLGLQNYILWGPDERRRQIWDQPTTEILADHFEMLIAVIYLERGTAGVKEFLTRHHFFEEIGRRRGPVTGPLPGPVGKT